MFLRTNVRTRYQVLLPPYKRTYVPMLKKKVQKSITIIQVYDDSDDDDDGDGDNDIDVGRGDNDVDDDDEW